MIKLRDAFVAPSAMLPPTIIFKVEVRVRQRLVRIRNVAETHDKAF